MPRIKLLCTEFYNKIVKLIVFFMVYQPIQVYFIPSSVFPLKVFLHIVLTNNFLSRFISSTDGTLNRENFM